MFLRVVFYFDVYLDLFLSLFFYIGFEHFLQVICGKDALTAAAGENYNFDINRIAFN